MGASALRRRWLVLGAWLVALGLALLAAGMSSGTPSEGLEVPGTEAQRAIDVLQQEFPDAAATGATARVVAASPAGESLSDPRSRDALSTLVEGLSSAPQVTLVAPHQPGTMSEDGRVGVLEVTYGVPAADLTAAARGTLQQALDGARRTEKVAEVGGDAVEEDPELGYAAVSPLTDT